ncbi:hypothetical protein ACLOJK_000309 [Asimina triloba]
MATAPESENLPTDPTPSLSLFLSMNRAWKRFVAYFPRPLSSNLLTRVWNLYDDRRIAAARYRRRKLGVPLPLASRNSLESSSFLEYTHRGMTETARIIDTLEDVLEQTLSSLHDVQKSLHFWQSRAEGTDGQKLYFMVFERGPRAFLNGTIEFIRGYASEESAMQALSYSASAMISERIAVLTRLQQGLATFLAQVYMEIHKFGEVLRNGPHKSLQSLLTAISDLFSKLEASIGNPYEIYKSDYSAFVDGNNTLLLHFDKLLPIDEERSQWTDCEITDAINMIYRNLQILDNHLSLLVFALLDNIRSFKISKTKEDDFILVMIVDLKGSQWIDRAKISALSFAVGLCANQMEEFSARKMGAVLLGIVPSFEPRSIILSGEAERGWAVKRDELFETFQRRHKSVTELEEVQLTANSLHRMLLAFSEQTKGEKLPENMSDQDMLEIVMVSYEKELTHPLQSLLGGELARALLIQIQKLKLDIETAMLELNQILRANEINFAILAALPAFFLSLSFKVDNNCLPLFKVLVISVFFIVS